jgi:predicted MFS family arabinose efflux permease
MGIVELSWSSAWLIGVPAAGILIEQWGWRAPWFALAGLGLAGIWLTHTQLPPARAPSVRAEANPMSASILATWGLLLRRRTVWMLLLASLLLTLSNEIPFIVYGAWLEASFGLGLSTLGLASTVIGLAEAGAELGTTVLTDRWGKRRSVVTGLLALVGSLILLPWLSELGLLAAMIGMVLMVVTFEFAIVSLLPLATEIAPEARASLLSLNITAMSLGRILGALAGGWLWQWQAPHITLHAALGALFAFGSALLIWFGIREPGK